MRAPSRLLPSRAPARKPTQIGWIVLTVLVVSIGWAIYESPVVRWCFAGATLVYGGLSFYAHRQHLRRARDRRVDSLCTFVRALEVRDHDTWVLRAVYEELTHLVRHPVRPADHLTKDLGIDADDLEDIAREIARRASRSLDDTKKNPLYGRVHTVADMIQFLEHQPKIVSGA